MTNLYIETMEKLRVYGKSYKDIVAIQGYDFSIDVNDFFALAKNINYDEGYGAAHIAADLTIVGEDWWMERDEYDGAENWKFRQKPKLRTNARKVSSLGGDEDQWPLLKDFVEEDEEDNEN